MGYQGELQLIMVRYWCNGNELYWSTTIKNHGILTAMSQEITEDQRVVHLKMLMCFCWDHYYWPVPFSQTSPVAKWPGHVYNRVISQLYLTYKWVLPQRHGLCITGPNWVPHLQVQENCPILYILERFPVKLGKRHRSYSGTSQTRGRFCRSSETWWNMVKRG